MVKNLSAFFALIFVFGLGVFATKQYYSYNETVTKENSQVLLERIKTVAKLVTVEGYFSEVYSHEDYYNFDLSPFRKKALLRVKAKVGVGYDLGKLKIDAFDEQKKIVISNIPDPEILFVEQEVDYYDIQEGTFNSFSEQELTDLNKRAKSFIEEKAKSDKIGLLPAAEEQMNKMLESIQFMVESAGYTLEYQTVYEDSKKQKMD